MERSTQPNRLPDTQETAASRLSAFDVVQEDSRCIAIRFNGPLNVHSSPPLLGPLRREIERHSFVHFKADLDGIDGFDDYGALVLMQLRKWVESKNATFERVDSQGKANKVLGLVGFDAGTGSPLLKTTVDQGFVAQLGNATLNHLTQVRFLVSFLGSVFMATLRILKHPGNLRYADVLTNMERTGVNALPIVALISFLLGLVMAFMSSLQLQQFGANIYVASLVAIAMVSELGPIMTAIVVAGRSGSAFAAEIGTMQISEEIDALTTMGFDPIQFLALPRIIAALLVIPLLTMFSNIFAIFGGLLVGVLLLDLTVSSYLTHTMEALSLFEVVWGMGKSMLFAGTIAMVGCLRGFQTKGGADAVGNAATSAVVTSIFLIILLDSIFAVTRSYWR